MTIKDTVKLADLEWAGHTKGTLYYMSGTSPLVPCCPVCYGIKPGYGGVASMQEGHKPDCKLAATLRQEKSEE